MQDNLISYSLVLLKAGPQSNGTSSYITSSTTTRLNCSIARPLPHIPQVQNIDPIPTCTQSFATEQASELLPCTCITLITSTHLLGCSNLRSVVQANMHKVTAKKKNSEPCFYARLQILQKCQYRHFSTVKMEVCYF